MGKQIKLTPTQLALQAEIQNKGLNETLTGTLGLSQEELIGLDESLKKLSGQRGIDPRNMVPVSNVLGTQPKAPTLSNPERNAIRDLFTGFNRGISDDKFIDGIREASNNTELSGKVLDDETGKLIDFVKDEWQPSALSFMGLNNHLFQKKVKDQVEDESLPRFNAKTGLSEMSNGFLDDYVKDWKTDYDVDQKYDYLVASEHEGKPILRLVKGKTRDQAVGENYSILNKYGAPDKFHNAGLLTEFSNGFSSLDDVALGAAKWIQDGVKGATGGDFTDKSWLDKAHYATVQDSKYTDFLASISSHEMGSADWLLGGFGNAMGSLAQFGVLGKGIRVAGMGVKELMGAVGKSSLSNVAKTEITQQAKKAVVDQAARWGSSGIIGFGHAYNTALRHGLDEADAWVYGLGVGALNTAIESYLGSNLDSYLTGGGPKIIARELLKEIDTKAVGKSTSDLLKNRGKELVESFGNRFKNMSSEGGEEVLQDIVEQGAQVVYDNFVKEPGEEAGFNHRKFDFMQTVSAGIFGAMAAAPFKTVKYTMASHILDGKSKEVSKALDKALADGSIAKPNYDKLKTHQERIESLLSVNKGIIDSAPEKYKGVIHKDIANLFDVRMGLEDKKERLLKDLNKVPLTDIKDKATDVSPEVQAIDAQISSLNKEIQNYGNSDFVKSRIAEFVKRDEEVKINSGKVFDQINSFSDAKGDESQEAFDKRIGALKAENFQNAQVARTPDEAIYAMKALKNKTTAIDSSIGDVLARDIVNNMLYLSPKVNTDENRAYLLSVGVPLESLPMTSSEKIEAIKTPDQFKGRYLTFDQLVNTINSVKPEDVVGKEATTEAISNLSGHEIFNHILMNPKKYGITDAMLAGLDNRDQLKSLFSNEQNAVIDKIFDGALPSSLLLADGLSKDFRGAFSDSNRFMYVSGNIKKLISTGGKANKAQQKEIDSLFHAIVHESGHSLFNKELTGMHQSWLKAKQAGKFLGKQSKTDYYLFDRLYKLATLSHKVLDGKTKYKSEYFAQIANQHFAITNQPARDAHALELVKEFYAESLAKESFQALLDEFDLNASQNEKLLNHWGYNYNKIDVKKSLLSEIMEAVSSVFTRFKNLFTKQERTILREAFELGSNISYNRFQQASLDTSLPLGQQTISMFDPIILFEEGELDVATKLAENLMSRINKGVIVDESNRYDVEARASLQREINKFVDQDIYGDEQAEYVAGSAIAVFFNATKDFMVTWRTVNIDGGPDDTHRAFFSMNGKRRNVNTNIANKTDATDFSKIRIATFSTSTTNEAVRRESQIMVDYDRAFREGFTGKAFLRTNENHTFKINGKEYRGAVDIVYNFSDGAKVIGHVADLAKLRLTQMLNEGISIDVIVKAGNGGSNALVKRDEAGNLVDIKQTDTVGLNPKEYLLEKGVMPSTTFTYSLNQEVVPENVQRLIDLTDSLTAQDSTLPARADYKDFLTVRQILESRTEGEPEDHSSLSLYSPESSHKNKIIKYEPGTLEAGIDYVQKGLRIRLMREMAWVHSQRYSSTPIPVLLARSANFYTNASTKYLQEAFGSEASPEELDSFDNLGFATQSEFNDFKQAAIDEVVKTFVSSDHTDRENYSENGGNPSGKISFALRIDLESINYVHDDQKYWMTFGEASEFLFEAANNSKDYADMVQNLKDAIDERKYGGRQLVQAQAIYEHFTKARPNPAEKAIWDAANLTYWSQFSSYVKLSAITVEAGENGARVFFNGKDQQIKQIERDFIDIFEKKIDEIKVEAKEGKITPEQLYEEKLKNFFLSKHPELSGYITRADGKYMTLGNKIGALHSKFKNVDEFRGIFESNNNLPYGEMEIVTKAFYEFFGIELPNKLFEFKKDGRLYKSIEHFKRTQKKRGLRNDEIDKLIQDALVAKPSDQKDVDRINDVLSENLYTEVNFTPQNKTKGVYPFIMLAMQAASFQNREIVRALKGNEPDWKDLKETGILAESVLTLSGEYSSPEFYFNARFEKEWAFKIRSYMDVRIGQFADPTNDLIDTYLATDAYKNNRFLQSIKKSNGEPIQVVLSGLTDGNENGKSYNDAISMDYLYMNLGLFLKDYSYKNKQDQFYYHIDDVTSDKPRNVGIRMARIADKDVRSEIQNILSIEAERGKRFGARFDAAFTSNGNGTFTIKNQEAFDKLPVNVFYQDAGNGLYKKGWAFNSTHSFYEGKPADQIESQINSEAIESYNKWSSKINIPLPKSFTDLLDKQNGLEPKANKIEAEQKRLYIEWFKNNVINRYHVSQVLMGDNIYYKPDGLLDLSKRHTNAPAMRGKFKNEKIKAVFFNDVLTNKTLPGVKIEDGDARLEPGRDFSGINTTDAQGYVTEQFAQDIKDSFGIFSPFEKVFKPVVFGVSKDKIKDAQPLYLKLSLAVLPDPEKAENRAFYDSQPKMEGFAKKLYASGANFGVFQSGVKVGLHQVNTVDQDQYSITDFDSDLFGIQNNPKHDANADDNFINGAIQMTKQLGDNGENAKAMESYHQIEGALLDLAVNEFIEENLSDKKKVNDVIKQILAQNAWSNPISEFLDDELSVLDNPITATMAEQIINAHFKKKISLAKKAGDKLVNLSNFMATRPELTREESIKRDALLAQLGVNVSVYVNDLQWLGPRKPEQLTLFQLEQLVERSESEDIFNDEGYIIDSNGQLMIFPAEALTDRGQNYQIGDKAISIRIPTSKKSNVIPIVIVGHTAASQGNVIILSEHGPAILGFDFDVDGLFTWRARREKNESVSDMFDIAYGILTNPKNYNEMISPVETSRIDKLASVIQELKSDDSFKFSKWTPEKQLELKTLNSIGKQMISATASYYGMHSMFAQNGGAPYVSNQTTTRAYRYGDQLLDSFVRSYQVGENEVMMSDVFSEFLNAAADNAKLQTLGKASVNPFLAPVLFDMIGHGIPMSYAVHFINQPSIQEFYNLTETQNAASFNRKNRISKNDLVIRINTNLENQIRALGGKYANYSFANYQPDGTNQGKSKMIRRIGKDQILLTSDNQFISIGALKNGIKSFSKEGLKLRGSVSSIGNNIDQKFALLENQLVALDKFIYYQSLSKISRDAGKLIGLTSSYPKTFIELIDVNNKIRDVAFPKTQVNELGEEEIVSDKKIDIDQLLFNHGSYKVQWEMLNTLISNYSKFKMYAHPGILKMHQDLAGGQSVELQQRVMEDFYTYMLQFAEESDNENGIYNLSTSSLIGKRIDPYQFVHQSANVINQLRKAYPENEFLRILEYKKNAKSEEQAQAKNSKPDQVKVTLLYDPKGSALERLRNDFLALPQNVAINWEGDSYEIRSTQDLILGHLLHTQGFRMGGFSFSKILPRQTAMFIDNVIQQQTENNKLALTEDVLEFPRQAKINHRELIRTIGNDEFDKGIESAGKHFESGDEWIKYDGLKGLMVRKLSTDGSEVISIANDPRVQRFLDSLIKSGLVRMKDRENATREYVYEVSPDYLVDEASGKKYITLTALPTLSYKSVKNYGENVEYNSMSDRAILNAVFNYATPEDEAIQQEQTVPFSQSIVASDVIASDIQSGAQRAVSLTELPNVKVGDVIELQTSSGPVSVTVRVAPYSLKQIYNDMVINNLNEGSKLISDSDVLRFKSKAQKDGKNPTSFFTTSSTFKEFYDNAKGVRGKNPDSTIWIQNDAGLYDLVNAEDTGKIGEEAYYDEANKSYVNPDTGEVLAKVYYKNVNMFTGRIKDSNASNADQLKQEFVTRWAELENKDKNQFQFNDLMSKFQMKVTPVKTAIEVRTAGAIEKIKLNSFLDEAEKLYFIDKLTQAKSDEDIDLIVDELITKCKP